MRFCLDDGFRDECAGDFANPIGNVQTKIKYGSTCCQFSQIEYVASFVNSRFCCLEEIQFLLIVYS